MKRLLIAVLVLTISGAISASAQGNTFLRLVYQGLYSDGLKSNVAIFEPALSLTETQMVAVQRRLAELGFDVGPADGIFGPRTRGAIAEWQEAQGRPATGRLDAEEARLLLKAGETTSASDSPRKAVQEATEAVKRKDFAKALELARPLAEQGYPAAQLMMGHLYMAGRIVEKDPEEGIRWFRLAADQGHAEAQHVLGQIHFSGAGVTEDRAEGIRWFRLAADQGYAKAQYVIGRLYFGGNGVPKDRAEGARWIRLAAEQGEAGAQWLLGILLSQGEGLAQDHADSSWWFCRAALQGHVDAQYSLGLNYFTGTGVPEDHREAVIWLFKAGDQGHSEALDMFTQIIALTVIPGADDIEWSSLEAEHCVHE